MLSHVCWLFGEQFVQNFGEEIERGISQIALKARHADSVVRRIAQVIRVVVNSKHFCEVPTKLGEVLVLLALTDAHMFTVQPVPEKGCVGVDMLQQTIRLGFGSASKNDKLELLVEGSEEGFELGSTYTVSLGVVTNECFFEVQHQRDLVRLTVRRQVGSRWDT